MTCHRLQTEITLDAPLEEVFRFHAEAKNLETITPPWMRLRVLHPVEMGEGAVIDYRLRVRGVPLRWRSEVTTWDPPNRFVDEQRRGPFRLWIHEHDFAASDGRTRSRDRVTYAAPGGELANRLFLEADLRRIFRYRHAVLTELFGRVGREPKIEVAEVP
ncbi:MAG: SRPBCC family protein [Gemmatimonadota bacterium]|nr:SRPBCC family protein [Gemmatimonadota bacterium]